MIQRLVSKVLLDSYVQATALQLDAHFIYLLQEEIRRRGLPLHPYTMTDGM